MPPRVPKNSDDQKPDETGQDTEGHNLWVNPGASRELARGRNADREREMRERQRAKEAKGR
ncbi:MAG: hypothetical protein QOH61_2297 [Chloroflexota bacterium]|jgi:hypothetical protein|nr:hypothetical protein [Chloroflexota bacterium]